MKTSLLLIPIFVIVSCSQGTITDYSKSGRAIAVLDSIYAHYQAENSCLLYETFPFDSNYKADYLAKDEAYNQYAYLWPYSGVFSAINAISESESKGVDVDALRLKVLAGLEEYFDTRRSPQAYASYINSAPISDRFYDDNVWLGIDFTDVYQTTRNLKYLEKAKLIWNFILSGTDDKLGGGIYWCEQKKESKNTCSNAPASVLAFKLFQATGDSTYFRQGQRLYAWTKSHLQDTDYLYFDNIALDGRVSKIKYAYNSGQMMQAAALQYKLTNDSIYLAEAQNIAKACYEYFFYDFRIEEGTEFRMIKKGDVWFTAVMLRGFIELYQLDGDKTYIDNFGKCLDYAWLYARNEQGLFNVDFTGKEKDDKNWLLTQAAMAEMYARMAVLNL